MEPGGFIITVVVILMFAGAFMISRWVGEKYRFKEKDQKRFKKHWELILKEVENNPKGAVMEADKLLDEALKIKGFQGTLGEKLKKAKIMFKDVNSVWTAHKLRNRLAHELTAQVSVGEAKVALSQFKRGINDLGANL